MTRTILVVEDSPTSIAAVSYTLKKHGYDVLASQSGERAMARMNSTTNPYPHIDLIIVDINMPGMNGIEFTKMTKTIDAFRFTPIIILTTESQASLIEEGKRAGASAWLVKPFQPEQLTAVVNKNLTEA